MARNSPLDYVEPMAAGSFFPAYSFYEAVQEAQENGTRLRTNAQFQETANYLEGKLHENPYDSGALESLSELYGNHFGNPGYAGARTMTGTIVREDGAVINVDKVFGKYIYGDKSSYYSRQLENLLSQTKKMQAGGKTAYIQEFDEERVLPIAVGEEPNQKYRNAVFYISPSVNDAGVVVRGIQHSVGEPSAKYNIALLSPSYKDIMLGHRTVSESEIAANRARLSMMGGVAAGLVYELAEKVAGRKISPVKALEKIHNYINNSIRDKRMHRRTFLAAAGLLSFLAAGCGGGGSGGGNPNPSPNPNPTPQPPPSQTFTYSGSVLKRIANDGSKVTQGSVRLEGAPGTFTGNIDSAGNFSVAGIRSGTYRRTTSDGASDSVFVPQVESVVQINGNLTGQNYSVIERGANRFGVPFDGNFQNFYFAITRQTSGILKWGNNTNQRPTKIRMVASTIPDDIEMQFRDCVASFVNRDTPLFSGGRLSTLPVEFGETGSSLETEVKMEDLPASLTDFPNLDGRRIVNARIRYRLAIADVIRGGSCPPVIGHEYFHTWGVNDINDPNFDSYMNDPATGRRTDVPSVADKLAAFVFNHQNVSPGNTAPDTNP